MVSKVLLMVLLTCTCITASPIDRNTVELPDENVAIKVSILEEFMKGAFGKLAVKIFNVITETLSKIFQKIGEELDTPDFREAMEELQKIAGRILDENDEINANSKVKEIIEEELMKVTKSFAKIVDKAGTHAKEDKYEKVDTTEFKRAVEQFKMVIDKYFD